MAGTVSEISLQKYSSSIYSSLDLRLSKGPNRAVVKTLIAIKWKMNNNTITNKEANKPRKIINRYLLHMRNENVYEIHNKKL